MSTLIISNGYSTHKNANMNMTHFSEWVLHFSVRNPKLHNIGHNNKRHIITVHQSACYHIISCVLLHVRHQAVWYQWLELIVLTLHHELKCADEQKLTAMQSKGGVITHKLLTYYTITFITINTITMTPLLLQTTSNDHFTLLE